MAEVINLNDKYIDASSIYDVNKTRTQQQFNYDIDNHLSSLDASVSSLSSVYQCDVCYAASGDQTFSGEIVFNYIINNIGNCYSNSTGRFTCPVNGIYIVSFGYFSNANAFSEINRPTIYKNGVMNIMTSVNPCNITDILYCNAGDTLSAGCYFGSISFYCGVGHNWFKVALLHR